MSLRAALDKVKNAVVDLTTLEVQTYSGTVDIINRNLSQADAQVDANADITGAGETKTNSKSIRSIITQAKSDENVHLKLVAESVYQFDGDSYNFLTSDASVPKEALDLHRDAVTAGLEARQGLLDLFKDIVT